LKSTTKMQFSYVATPSCQNYYMKYHMHLYERDEPIRVCLVARLHYLKSYKLS
jgi:hypothetical protein